MNHWQIDLVGGEERCQGVPKIMPAEAALIVLGYDTCPYCCWAQIVLTGDSSCPRFLPLKSCAFFAKHLIQNEKKEEKSLGG
ncbi:MAG: hypothetical protein BGO25_08200 [Acidobacteriales bacterium 59-55]|nr:MAG: hypothetical protein BGO25_08200 [Acidobacteriales bacterium 59-55]